jgi:hypothetical protein
VARLRAGTSSKGRAPSADVSAGETARRELVEDVEPAYVDALAVLAAACLPFDVRIDAAWLEAAGFDAVGVEALGVEALAQVTARAGEAGQARRQQALEDAESECRARQERLELHLARAGLPAGGPDDLAARVKMATDRADGARSALATPVVTRTIREVEADLARARGDLAACSAPGVDEPPPAVDDPADDGGAPAAERSRLFQDLQRTERDLPDVAPLADRHAALERRVAELEASFSAGCALPDFSEAEAVLLERVAQARRVGRNREPLPLLVNDALAAFTGKDKIQLLDVLARLGEKTQIVYLTDDPDTLTWASGRAGAGEVALWPSAKKERSARTRAAARAS